MTPEIVIACDPGISGGIALVDSTGMLVHGAVMPRRAYGKNDMVDPQELQSEIDRGLLKHASHTMYLVRTIIEQVSAMPKQGVVSMFNFGMSYGIAIGVLDTYAEVEFVTPKKWKEDMSLTEDKALSVAIATATFGHGTYWKHSDYEGVAEAALLGRWYWKHKKGLDI